MFMQNPVLKSALAVTLAVGLAAGCQTTDPYTGETKTSSATYGALIGAGAGAAVGMISGHDAKQRRQRAFQSTQIHYGFSHALSGTIESCLSAAGM